MSDIQASVFAGVKMTCNQLSDEELNAICMVAIMGSDPRHVIGYEKAKSLFTENGGTKMHSDTLRAVEQIRNERVPV